MTHQEQQGAVAVLAVGRQRAQVVRQPTVMASSEVRLTAAQRRSELSVTQCHTMQPSASSCACQGGPWRSLSAPCCLA
jgi:hypothetical protein